MKDRNITIRINPQTKIEFKEICERENTTMSDEIEKFMLKFINERNGVSIRGILINTIVDKLLSNLLFYNSDRIDEIKDFIQTKLNNNLIFETKLSDLKIKNGFLIGDILFSDENGNTRIINFTIITNKL